VCVQGGGGRVDGEKGVVEVSVRFLNILYSHAPPGGHKREFGGGRILEPLVIQEKDTVLDQKAVEVKRHHDR
jgi:hypothetical protein